jgi:hypothetical protein
MIGKEYLYTAQALLRVAKNITDQTIANRLMVWPLTTSVAPGRLTWRERPRW